jgi:hypothetical protein
MDDRALSHTVQAWQYLLMTRRRKLLPTPIFGICSVANVQEPFPLYSWMLMGGGEVYYVWSWGGPERVVFMYFVMAPFYYPRERGRPLIILNWKVILVPVGLVVKLESCICGMFVRSVTYYGWYT